MIDILFWAWILVTIALFIDIIIPDPIPFVDELILGILFVIGLVALFLRRLIGVFTTTFDTFLSPGVLAFIVVIVILYVGKNILSKKRGKKK